MVIYVDIDETICEHLNTNPALQRDYRKATPIKKNIEKINKLYDEGNTIVYWTARGGKTGIDWTELTEKQLLEWGAKHNEFRMGKPYYDLFICDKAINSNDFFKRELKNGNV